MKPLFHRVLTRWKPGFIAFSAGPFGTKILTSGVCQRPSPVSILVYEYLKASLRRRVLGDGDSDAR